MRFSFDASSPVIAALLQYAKGDKQLLELAMHNALRNRGAGEMVTVVSIMGEIDNLQKVAA